MQRAGGLACAQRVHALRVHGCGGGEHGQRVAGLGQVGRPAHRERRLAHHLAAGAELRLVVPGGQVHRDGPVGPLHAVGVARGHRGGLHLRLAVDVGDLHVHGIGAAGLEHAVGRAETERQAVGHAGGGAARFEELHDLELPLGQRLGGAGGRRRAVASGRGGRRRRARGPRRGRRRAAAGGQQRAGPSDEHGAAGEAVHDPATYPRPPCPTPSPSRSTTAPTRCPTTGARCSTCCAITWACGRPRTAAHRRASAGAAPCWSTVSPAWRA